MPADVLVAVEHEKMKRGQARADRFIYDAVGRQFGIKGSTAAKEASISLSDIRREAERMLQDGEERNTVFEWATGLLDLPVDRAEALLLGPLLEK